LYYISFIIGLRTYT